MSEKQDGGPAFPLATSRESNKTANGMSLRDYFAGQVLTGLMVNATGLDNLSDSYLCAAAKQVWRMADAMLVERGVI